MLILQGFKRNYFLTQQTIKMKRILNVFLLILITIAAAAQTDVVSVEETIGIYNNGKLANAKTVLEKQGYRYKGVSNLAGRDYCWAKNVELTKDFIPQSYGRGNSSIFLLATDGKTAFLYVYNQKAFAGLKAQVRSRGYNMHTEKDGSIICTRDKQPTITFMQLQMPYPFCMMITE